MPDQVGHDYSVYPGWYDSYVCYCRHIMFVIGGILCLSLPAYYDCHCWLIMFVIAGLTGNLFNHFVNVNLQVASIDEIV